MLITLFCL